MEPGGAVDAPLDAGRLESPIRAFWRRVRFDGRGGASVQLQQRRGQSCERAAASERARRRRAVGPSGRHSVASSTRTPKKRRTSSTTSSASIYVQPRARTYEGFDAARELSKSATASE